MHSLNSTLIFLTIFCLKNNYTNIPRIKLYKSQEKELSLKQFKEQFNNKIEPEACLQNIA